MGDTLTDADVRTEIERYGAIVKERRALLAEGLRRLEEAAARDRQAALADTPDLTLTYGDAEEAVRQLHRFVRVAEDDLESWQREWTRRAPTRDTESSASAQHYIDTGDYLHCEVDGG
jgi:hypothetical protein